MEELEGSEVKQIGTESGGGSMGPGSRQTWQGGCKIRFILRDLKRGVRELGKVEVGGKALRKADMRQKSTSLGTR